MKNLFVVLLAMVDEPEDVTVIGPFSSEQAAEKWISVNNEKYLADAYTASVEPILCPMVWVEDAEEMVGEAE